MILLEGGSLDFLSTAALAGKLPNFGRVLDRGAAMHLATNRPTQPAPVWTSVATGKLPWKTGVRSAARYHLPGAHDALELLPENCFAQGLLRYGLISSTEHTAGSLRARPLWSILATAGLSTGIVNWPLTYPSQPVRGYLVSDRFYRPDDASLEPDDPAAIYPLEMLPSARTAGDAARRAFETVEVALTSRVLTSLPPDGGGGRLELTDRMYEEIWRSLQLEHHPHLSAVRLCQLDLAGHSFLRYALPAEFGDVTLEERRQYGQVLEAAYSRIDVMVGRAMSTLEADDLLLVVSGFGMEPMHLGKRALEKALGDPVSGSHENAPDGFMLAYGAAVSPGRKRRASIVDVAPTILYFLGLPVGRDMDGYARPDIFLRDFSDQRPIAFIPTYER
jgi:predicted AlkP superfamily phosphohydrolase/phosphomutase